MGYNSVIFIVNDGVSAIDDDPAGWWQKVKQSLGSAVAHPVTFGHGGFMNHYTVVSNHHADDTSLISVGGNMAQVLGRYHTGVNGPGSAHHTVEGQAALVKRWAEDHGYELVVKRGPLVPTPPSRLRKARI